MAKIEKSRPCKIDTLLGDLTEEGRSEFANFTSVERTLSDIQRWWAERGFSVPLSTVDTWRKRHYKEGKRAREIALLVKETRGINPLHIIEYSIAESMFVIEQMRSQLGDEPMTIAQLNTFLKAIRELRTSAESLHNAKIRSDRTQDILSGAYEVCRKALTAAKDHPNERWLEEILSGELKAIEEELIREQVGDAT